MNNEKLIAAFTDLEKDEDFQYLYSEYKKAVTGKETTKQKVLRISITDYVKKKHKKLWKYFGKKDFIENYTNNIGMRPEIH